jgi:hypothetical protein
MERSRADDLIEICRLKARYFRFLDTKQWAELRALLDDDLVYYADTSPVPESTKPAVVGADAFVARVSQSFADAVSVHHGSAPEIDFITDNEATGIWAMYDWVDDKRTRQCRKGYGHYHDRYKKDTHGRWRMTEVRLTRIRVDLSPSVLTSAGRRDG